MEHDLYLLLIDSVRSVLVKYRSDVFSADLANQGPCRKTEVRYFTSTD